MGPAGDKHPLACAAVDAVAVTIAWASAKLASGSLQQYFTGLRFFSKTSLNATRAPAEQSPAPDPAPVPQPHGPACCPNPIGEKGSDVHDAWQGKWKSLPGGLGLAKVEAHIEGGQQVMKLGSRSGSVLPAKPVIRLSRYNPLQSQEWIHSHQVLRASRAFQDICLPRRLLHRLA